MCFVDFIHLLSPGCFVLFTRNIDEEFGAHVTSEFPIRSYPLGVLEKTRSINLDGNAFVTTRIYETHDGHVYF